MHMVLDLIQQLVFVGFKTLLLSVHAGRLHAACVAEVVEDIKSLTVMFATLKRKSMNLLNQK